jgi:hypothetical protein
MATKKQTTRSAHIRPGEKVKVLITRDRIHRRILEIAKQIRADFPEEPLLLVWVLKGAVFFLISRGESRARYRLISLPCRATEKTRKLQGK